MSRFKDKIKKKSPSNSDDDDNDNDLDDDLDDEEEDDRFNRNKKKPMKKAASNSNSSSIKGKRMNNRRNGSRGVSDDDDDDDENDEDDESSRSAIAQYANKPNAEVLKEDEQVENDSDNDEWRLANRSVRSAKNDPLYAAQFERWIKFRLEFPIPLRQFLSSSAIYAFRQKLKLKKRLITGGIPIHLRRDIWELLSGARTFPERLEFRDRYQYYLAQKPSKTIIKEIASDVGRALRGHMKFLTKTGQAELTRVLTAFAIRSPAIGYANSMCHIAAFLLLFYPEERSFWCLCSIVDIILPPDYYTNSLLGARADSQLIKILVFQRLPKLHTHLTKLNIDVYIVSLRWLMPLFLTTLPIHVVIRVWDVMMMEGSSFLLSVALALFILHTKQLLLIRDESDMLVYINQLGMDDKSNNVEEILNMALSSRCNISKEELDRRDIERRIMENDYMKDLQITQKIRREQEERKKKEEEARKKEIEQEEKALEYGTEMWKIGRKGKARKTKIYLINETPEEEEKEKKRYIITWDSKNKPKTESTLVLKDCSLYYGMKHGQFANRPEFQRQFHNSSSEAFSLVSPNRSLDLVCTSGYDMEEWGKVLSRIPMKSKEEYKSLEKLEKEKERAAREKMREMKRKAKSSAKNDEEDEDGGSKDEEEKSDKGKNKRKNGTSNEEEEKGKKGGRLAAMLKKGASGGSRAGSDNEEDDEELTPPVRSKYR